MARTVVLRHDLPDGGWHYDWLLERPDRPGGALLTFRTALFPPLAAGALIAERMPDHRRLYLSFEGEVSGGRGWVRREAEGVVEALEEHPEMVRVVAAFGGRRRTYEGRRVEGPAWEFFIQD